MIRKFLALAALAAVGLLATPGVANAYEPPPEPILVVPADIEAGEQVPVLLDNWLPGSDVTLTVAADGVDGDDIGLTVLGSNSITTTVESDGTATIGVVFPEPAVYTLTATGLDLDGNPATVSALVQVGGGGPGPGLPPTGFSGQTALLTGAGLLGAGALAIALSKRRSSADRESVSAGA